LVLAALVVQAACSRGTVIEQDGQGGIFSMKGESTGYWHGRAIIGQMWTAGGVTLCRSTPDVVARVVSIEPVKVTGEVRVDAIRVRTSLRPPPDLPVDDWDPNVYLFNGPGPAPSNALSPAGYLVPTACLGPKVGEVITTMTKTGPAGGMLQGLKVTYRWDGRLHQFVIPWTFGLCGTGTKEQCA